MKKGYLLIRKTRFSLLTFLTLSAFVSNAQNVGINATGAAPVSSAALDVDIANKGVLIPRVALTDKTVFAPVTGTPTTSLLVYNTNTAGALPNNVTPGFYYWNVNRWQRLIDGTPSIITGSLIVNNQVNLFPDQRLNNTSITLPQGRWMVHANFIINGANNMVGTVGTDDAWVRYTLSSSTTARQTVGFNYVQNDVFCARVYKSNINWMQNAGTWLIDVTNPAGVTLCVWTFAQSGNCGNLFVGANPENYFYAVPMP
jgi:hypothetical protein